MTGFAIKNDGSGFHAVESVAEISSDEYFSEIIPDQTELQILNDVKVKKIAMLYSSCKYAIMSGFTSSALGSDYLYPSKEGIVDGETYYDQTNLIGAAASGLPIIAFTCSDMSGIWARRDHTASQIKQVLADANVQRINYYVKLDSLVNSVNAAIDKDAVLKIIW